jgi:hypothetical protein
MLWFCWGGGGLERIEWDGTKHKEVPKIYYLCLNSWSYMPLVLLSEQYLLACNAKVCYRKTAPNANAVSGMLENKNPAVDCGSPSYKVCRDGDSDNIQLTTAISQIGLNDPPYIEEKTNSLPPLSEPFSYVDYTNGD